MLDRKRSLELALKLVNRRVAEDYYTPTYQPSRCWHNAIKAMRLYRKQLANAVYVEGWCHMPEIYMVQPHGWIELEDGTILDPTYVYRDYEESREVSLEYFPALRYTHEELKGVRTSFLPIVEQTYGRFTGLRNEAYRAAYEQAYASYGIDITETYTEAYKKMIAAET